MPRNFIAVIGPEQREISEQRLRSELSGTAGSVEVLTTSPGATLLAVRRDERLHRVFVRTLSDGSQEVWIGRFRIVVGIHDERHHRLSAYILGAQKASAGSAVRAPMPGLIKEVLVRQGDAVKRGQRLLTLEAMKMENEIASPSDGIVDACRLEPGTSVDKGQELLHITPPIEH